ncbi:hypothetical protein T4D_6398 [Trichinella pseudospiralis]|uniref:Uncharacterized protein n=1 Tax=Trichinella pseudospiralis TaxID=6337 RepID=A0A0V1FKG6_TRIPS|nr:hypothetical protein T4D_6398 [Trichinella pseudospiralis]
MAVYRLSGKEMFSHWRKMKRRNIWVSLPWAVSFLGATTNVARTEFYGQLSNLGCRFTKNFVHGVWLAIVD